MSSCEHFDECEAQAKRIRELEAENKRLREALTELLVVLSNGHDIGIRMHEHDHMLTIARAALQEEDDGQ